MRDPYEILGIQPGADETALREAYRGLARRYENNPRRMQEINDAYDSVILSRGSGGVAWQGAGPGQTQTQTQNQTQTQYQYANPQWASSTADLNDIRGRIQEGRFDDALTLLDGMPPQRRTGEWYYLKGCAQRGRGWLEEAEKLFSTAAQMDPGRGEYRAAYDEMRSRRQGGYRARQARGSDDDDKCCKICGGLLCADCCCECFGGDLIPCC